MSNDHLPTVDVREAARRLDATITPPDAPAPLLVDVREESEFVALRVPGAILLPISRFTQGMAALPTDRPLLMLCKVGGRSASATEYLLRSGYPDVANVAGGIVAWHAAGLPTLTGPVGHGEGGLPTSGSDAA